MDITQLYKKLKQYELDNFEDGGPYIEGTNLSNPEEFQFLGEDISATYEDDFMSLLSGGHDSIKPFTTEMSGVNLPPFDLSQGNTSSVYQTTGPEENQTLAEKLKSSLGIDVPTSNSILTPQSDNYDNLSFAQAFKQANAKLGNNGTFTFKGRKYSTQRAGAVNSSRPKSNTGSSSGSGESEDFNKLKTMLRDNPTPEAISGYSTQFLKSVLAANVGSGEAQQLVKEAIQRKEGGKANMSSKQMQDINSLKEQIKKEKNNYEILKQKELINNLKVNLPVSKQAQEAKNKRKISDMKIEGENVIFNGERYSLRDKAQFSALRTKVSESEDGMFNSSGRDKLSKLSRDFYNNSSIDKRKGLKFFEDGGELPEFLLGGEYQDPTKPLIDPNTGRTLGLTPEMDAQIKALGNQTFMNYVGADGVLQNRAVPETYRNKIITAESDLNRFSFDGNTGKYNPLTIKKGEMYDNVLDTFYNSSEGQTVQSDYDKSQRLAQDDKLNLLNQLGTIQDYDVPEDLRMLGKSLAFDSNNAKYSTDGARKTAQGANLARGIFAGLDAVVGGARDVFSGYAYQQRQQNTENDFYEDQRKALERQRMQFGAKGGRINDILSMFEEEDDQDKRPNLPIEKLMTGEFIQQAPVQTGMEPNAELEKKEYVQHNDGEVQQVIGRSHPQGGEKLSLEPGTTVVSDKVKLGAKNARDLNKQYDLNLKAGDTFAHAVEKFTKIIGLTKTNSEQEDYFKQLKKVSESENSDSQTSELNNSFLSGKISEIEAKKAALESSRADFTSHVYSMQEASKPTEEREEMVQEESFNENGGSIPSFEEGGPYTLEELIAMNNQLGTNSMNPSLGGDQWNAMYYQPMDRWQQYLGQTPTKRNTHLDYQKDVLNLLNPQLKKLIETGEMGLTNKHRELLSKAGVKDANNKTSFAQLTADDKKKLSNVEQFVTEGFGDGLAGHRGVTVLQGNATEEEYQKMAGPYDKLTDAEGRKIYAEYNPDNTVKRTKDGKIVFYYPKTGEKVPESKAPADPTAGTSEFRAPRKTPYTPPVLPSQRPVAPTAASPVPIYQTRLGRIDPVNLGVDQQLTEIYRQSNAAGDQMEGLTDTQRAAALTNLTANTQKSASDVINNTAVQNAMNLFNVQQQNTNTSNTEEQARVQNAMNADTMWGKTEANQEADNRDYQEALQRIKLGRFRYLTKDRQMHDMIENFKVGADGGIEFDQASAQPITLPSGATVLRDKNGRYKQIDQVRKDANGNIISTSTSISDTGKKGR